MIYTILAAILIIIAGVYSYQRGKRKAYYPSSETAVREEFKKEKPKRKSLDSYRVPPRSLTTEEIQAAKQRSLLKPMFYVSSYSSTGTIRKWKTASMIKRLMTR